PLSLPHPAECTTCTSSPPRAKFRLNPSFSPPPPHALGRAMRICSSARLHAHLGLEQPCRRRPHRGGATAVSPGVGGQTRKELRGSPGAVARTLGTGAHLRRGRNLGRGRAQAR